MAVNNVSTGDTTYPAQMYKHRAKQSDYMTNKAQNAAKTQGPAKADKVTLTSKNADTATKTSAADNKAQANKVTEQNRSADVLKNKELLNANKEKFTNIYKSLKGGTNNSVSSIINKIA